MTHQRLSVHNVTFYGAPLTDLQKYWTDLAVTRFSGRRAPERPNADVRNVHPPLSPWNEPR